MGKLEHVALVRMVSRNRIRAGGDLTAPLPIEPVKRDIEAICVERVLEGALARRTLAGIRLHPEVWPYLRAARLRPDLCEMVREIEKLFDVSFEVLA